MKIEHIFLLRIALCRFLRKYMQSNTIFYRFILQKRGLKRVFRNMYRVNQFVKRYLDEFLFFV